MTDHLAEKDHTPVKVYEMPDGGQEILLRRIDAGTAVLAMQVCSTCATDRVLSLIDDGELPLDDAEAHDAQWPCRFARVYTPGGSPAGTYTREGVISPPGRVCDGCTTAYENCCGKARAARPHIVDILPAAVASPPGGSA